MHKSLTQRMAMMVHNHRICATAALVVFLAASLGCSAGIAAESKQVMLLHSFGRDFKPWSEYARTMRIELSQQSPWPLDITEHALVTARSPDEGSEIAFVEYLRALSAKRSPSGPLQRHLSSDTGRNFLPQRQWCSRLSNNVECSIPASRRTTSSSQTGTTFWLLSRISCKCCRTPEM